MAEESKEQISADDWGAAMAEQAAVDPHLPHNRMCSNNLAAPEGRPRTTTWT